MKKRGLSVGEYLLKVNNLADNLKYSGYMLASNDHVLYVLFGLGIEYDPFAMTINAKAGKPDAYTIEEVESFEKRAKKNSGENYSANVASNNKGGGAYNPRSRDVYNSGGYDRNDRNRGGYSPSRNIQQNKDSGRGGYTPREGGGRFSQNDKPQCQLCLTYGHTLVNYFYKFDKSFGGSNNSFVELIAK